jgi:hypothetical protein
MPQKSAYVSKRLTASSLFKGCPDKDIMQMAKHLNFKSANFRKKDTIFSVGDIFSVPKLFEPCGQCDSQGRLIQNLVVIGAQKNLQLSRHSIHTTPKTIRGRID